MSKVEVKESDDLTYHVIDSPLTRASSVAKPFAVSFLAGLFLIFSGGSASSSVWEDEELPEEDAPEGIELYDERATTITSASGDYIAARSIASPELFDHIGDGSFNIEWDVYIEPAEDVTFNDRVDVSVFYDSSIDLRITVERCQSTYPAPPNYQGDSNTSCDGQTASWENVDIAASGYIGNLSEVDKVGDFMLQNGAYLRFTIEPVNPNNTQIGDIIDGLEVHAEGFDERVVVGHTSGSGRVESTDVEIEVSDEDSLVEEDQPATEEETEPSDEEQQVEEEEALSPEPTENNEEEDANGTEESNEETAVEEDSEGIPIMSWIIGGVAAVLIGIGVDGSLLKRRGSNDDDGYDIEDDDDDYSSDESAYSRDSNSF